MMKRKLFALFTALTLCAALLAGCGGSSSAGTASSAPASEAASEAASGAAEARTGAENGAQAYTKKPRRATFILS